MRYEANDIQVVVEDLEYLRADWGGTISNPVVRRGSALLRRLLVENAYGNAWRALGFHGEPKVRAVDLNQIIGSTPLSEVDMALAAGSIIGKISMVGLSMTRSKKCEQS